MVQKVLMMLCRKLCTAEEVRSLKSLSKMTFLLIHMSEAMNMTVSDENLFLSHMWRDNHQMTSSKRRKNS